MSIRRKIQVTVVAVTLVCSIALGSLCLLSMLSFSNIFNEELLTNATELSMSLLEEYKEDAARASSLAASDGRLAEALVHYFESNDRQPLIDMSISLMNATGTDVLTILDVDGNVIVRAHEPDNFGDSLAGQTNIKSAVQGKQLTTIEKGTTVLLSVLSGTPINGADGAVIGIVSLGYRLDQDGFVDYIKKMTDAETTVFLGDTRISTTVLSANGERAIGTAASKTVSSQVLAGNDYRGRADVMGKSLLAHYYPILDAEGNTLGMLFVGLDTSANDAHIRQNLTILGIDVILLIIASLLGVLYVSKKIAGPVKDMSDAAARLAEGDLDVNVEISEADNLKKKDETVQLRRSFIKMIESNRERAGLISSVAHGDLSGNVTVNSKNDVVGTALTELLDKNNASFSNMADAAKQLDMASTQISEGAQNLAQSATEQATIIEKLHLRLTNVADKTKENAESARRAAALSESVKSSAEKGNLQMDQMMDAVDQISKASESIGKVIKAIDDIAFQTNILALNAAVEAARAGQHGKGFAVVAEEVRNLAAKSAEAAKDTGVLIANSIEKAKLGAEISTGTAESFAEIVSGINESSSIIAELVNFIQTQNSDIQDITRGIDEIGSVVQSVSAAAEQSSASSEEMSSQAASMAATLAEYKLRKVVNQLQLTEGVNSFGSAE